MSTDSIDYEAVLADLRAKRDKLEAAIAGIETMLNELPDRAAICPQCRVAVTQSIVEER